MAREVQFLCAGSERWFFFSNHLISKNLKCRSYKIWPLGAGAESFPVGIAESTSSTSARFSLIDEIIWFSDQNSCHNRLPQEFIMNSKKQTDGFCNSQKNFSTVYFSDRILTVQVFFWVFHCLLSELCQWSR